MSDAVYKSWSREQLLEQAMEYMRCACSLPDRNDAAAKDLWLQRLGLMVSFASWAWDTHDAYAPADPVQGETK